MSDRLALATSPVRDRPLRYRSLNSPSQRHPGSATPPYAASPANLCPPPFPHRFASVDPLRSICAAPSCATGLRPRLTPTPSASRSGRGVADESLMRLRTAAHTHEPCQQVVTPRVAAAHPKIGSRCSASKGQSGRLRAGCFDKVLLAGARPPLIRRGAWKEEKRCAFSCLNTTASGCKCRHHKQNRRGEPGY